MPKLHILHFNDVYHLNPQKQEPVGGAARFATAVKQFRARYPEGSSCVLFSGDVFNPSVESSISKGKHMVPPMNQLGVDASCIGNHDFDFGVPKLKYLIQSTNFPWVLSNLVDRDVDGPAAGHKFTVLERSGMKIGILGLVEKEWLETISNLPPNLEYVDFVTVAKDLSAELRDPKGPYAVDLVIALTHCRLPNDIILAKECRDEIDLVLGGHDHFYYVGKGCDVAEGWNREDVDGNQGDDGVRLVKSGTDFRELSVIECNVEEIDNDDGGTIKVITNACVTRHEINSSVEEDPHMAELIEKATSEASSKMSKPVAYTTVEWDCRSSTVRLKESAIGNFIGDLMYFCYEPCIDKIDCALLCGGTIRSDAVYPPGEITLGNLLEIFPFEDTLCVIRITGQQLWDALESAVSMVPKQEGRFPVVSGLKIEYNPRGEPGHRLRKIWLTERRPPTPLDSEEGEDIPRSQGRLEILGPIDRNGVYTMCTRSYLAKGYDGYKALAGPGVEWLIDDENGILLSTLIRRYFTGLYYVAAMKFNKSCADRTRETVRQIADKWKQLASTKGDAIVKGHLSRESICGSLLLSVGEKVQKPEEAKSVFMREWVTVAPVLEDRIVEVDY